MRPHVAVLALAAVLVTSAAALAQPFTSSEDARLAHGETVSHPQSLELSTGRYTGGVTYTVIDSSPAELDAILEDVSTYRRILPYTKDARFLAREPNDGLIWLRQGNALLDASYTIRVSRVSGPESAKRMVRFWLDRSRPHGIADASGFFGYEPLPASASGRPRTLLTFGIWVDLGPGIMRALFEGRIQRIILSVPQRLRAYVAEHRTGAT